MSRIVRWCKLPSIFPVKPPNSRVCGDVHILAIKRGPSPVCPVNPGQTLIFICQASHEIVCMRPSLTRVARDCSELLDLTSVGRARIDPDCSTSGPHDALDAGLSHHRFDESGRIEVGRSGQISRTETRKEGTGRRKCILRPVEEEGVKKQSASWQNVGSGPYFQHELAAL